MRYVQICLAMTILFGNLLLGVDDDNTYRGYSKIKYIEVWINDNSILSNYEAENMVKSVGYNTLPDNILFDSEKYNKYWADQYSLTGKMSTNKELTLSIDINAFSTKENNNLYFASIEVCLEGHALSELIEYRISDKMIEKLKKNGNAESKEDWEQYRNKWFKNSARYIMFRRGGLTVYSSKDDIKRGIRKYVQEIFDELMIAIKEYP